MSILYIKFEDSDFEDNSEALHRLFDDIKENMNSDITENLNISGETTRAETDNANQIRDSSPVEGHYYVRLLHLE